MLRARQSYLRELRYREQPDAIAVGGEVVGVGIVHPGSIRSVGLSLVLQS